MPTIKLKQWPSPLNAKRGSILGVALAAGVPYPHSCRSGECGACKSRLSAGEVLMDGYDPQVLTQEERDAGLILACRAHPRGDVEVAWLPPGSPGVGHPVRRVQATVAHIEAATHDIMRVRLKVDDAPLAFAAGQYAQLSFNGCPARPYSMANRPDDSTLEFHIRRVPGGVVSGHVARETRAGDPVQLEGPYGAAFLRQPAEEPIVLIAGGSGLAPMKSILLAALVQQVKFPIHLYHGVRDVRDIYDAQAIAIAGAGRVHYIPVLALASQPSGYREGLVHEALERDFQTLSGFKVYLAGPPPMVDAVTAAVLRLGARRKSIHADAFYAARDRHQRREEQRITKGFFRGLYRGERAN
jgi:CDP-4-dehydro-6-deoxyglucose reductase/ferredoxin-NAD(P)+ reductase (naphthalene dioxygenase ferredoxin-specific)